MEGSSDSDTEKDGGKESLKGREEKTEVIEPREGNYVDVKDVEGERDKVKSLEEKECQEDVGDFKEGLLGVQDRDKEEEGKVMKEVEVCLEGVITRISTLDFDEQSDGGSRVGETFVTTENKQAGVPNRNDSDDNNRDGESIKDYYTESNNINDCTENEPDDDRSKDSDSPVTTLSDISNSPCPSKIKAKKGFKLTPDIDEIPIPILVSTESAAIMEEKEKNGTVRNSI